MLDDMDIRVFESSVQGNQYAVYCVEYDGKNLIYTRVKSVPKVKKYLNSFDMSFGKDALYFGYSVTKNLDPNGWFSNPGALCEDGKYYICNEHTFMPEYVKMVKNIDTANFPESLSECVEVIVND